MEQVAHHPSGHVSVAATEQDAEVQDARHVQDAAVIDEAAIGLGAEEVFGGFFVRAEPQEDRVQGLYGVSR